MSRESVGGGESSGRERRVGSGRSFKLQHSRYESTLLSVFIFLFGLGGREYRYIGNVEQFMNK